MTDINAPIASRSSARHNDSMLNKLKRITTSAMLFIIAFVLSRVALQSMIAGISKLLDYQVRLTYNRVYVLPSDWHKWNRLRVFGIYVFPQLVCLSVGLVIFSLIAHSTSTTIKLYRVFLFWLSICLVNTFLSHLFFAPFGTGDFSSGYYQTFSIMASWMYIKPMSMSVFSTFSIIAAILWGLVVCNEVLRYSYSSSLIKTKKGQRAIVVQTFLLPVLLGFLPCMFLSKEFYLFPNLMMFMPLIFFWIGMMSKTTTDFAPIKGGKKDVLNHLPVIESIFAGGIWVAVWQFIK